MRTNQLIQFLASDTLVILRPARTQLLWAVGVGALMCMGLFGIVFGINPAIAQMVKIPTIQTKVLWLSALMGFSLLGLFRLSRPGMRAGHTAMGIGLSALAMIALGGLQYLQADANDRVALWMGSSWDVCAVNILGLSLPVLGVLLFALRQLAPTRPALTGAVAGLFSGSLAATVYSLRCPESSFVFYALWYLAGICLTTLLGSAIGTRALRW